GLTPLWEVLGALVPTAPTSPVAPVHFRYDAIRPHVMEAGRLISAEEAERRVLVLENPALRGQSCITQSLYAGLQLILPGEGAQADTRPEGDALFRYGSNLLPLDHAPAPHEPSRVFVYPFANTRAALAGIGRAAADPHFGFKLRYVNPATGRSPMPTIGTFA